MLMRRLEQFLIRRVGHGREKKENEQGHCSTIYFLWRSIARTRQKFQKSKEQVGQIP